MTIRIDAPMTASRFAGVLSAELCPKPLYDEALFETTDCVVTPTLGSILPNWVLVIPRVRALNFAEWSRATNRNPAGLIDWVAACCNVDADRLIWFEHGAATSGSVVGCGVEHAHLHVLIDAPFTFQELSRELQSSSQLRWRAEAATCAYSGLQMNKSYLFAASADHASIATDVEAVGSQFMRRAVARLIGTPETWDYKQYPHSDNIEMTVRNLSRARV
jgi:hypothetical protein